MPLPVVQPTAKVVSYHAEYDSTRNETRFVKKFGSILMAATRWFPGKLSDQQAAHNAKHAPHLFQNATVEE